MTWTLTTGNCLDILPTLDADSIDACVTDPPYGLQFMGSKWDHGIPGIPYWTEVFRVLKPGGWLLAFGGPRTHHRLMVAIEDAGFELRDCFCWLFGSGFPKALNISKAIDKAAGAKREITGPPPYTRGKATHRYSDTRRVSYDYPPQPITAPATPEAKLWDGWASALKPAYEPIILAMKPLDGTFAQNALTHGVAGLNVDGCRVPFSSNEPYDIKKKCRPNIPIGTVYKQNAYGERPTIPVNVNNKGRWPANVVLDEEAGAMLDEQTGVLHTHSGKFSGHIGYGKKTKQRRIRTAIADSGGASRFFYCAKASRSERTADNTITNGHPTIKPLALMRWLCRLVSTPTGSTTILDPFAGSGSTGVAALKEGLSFVGIELDPEYAEVARARIEKTITTSESKQLNLPIEGRDQP